MNLFNQEPTNAYSEAQKIPGLQFLNNYLSQSENDHLLDIIDKEIWLTDLKRRVQHYGFRYDYKARKIDVTMKIGELPIWAKEIANRLHNEGYFREIPDQLIVNEYLPGQGIAPHIDCEPCFEDTIASISLGSSCIMNFTNQVTSEKIPLLLPPCSLIILQEDSRYKWTHGIAPRKTDQYEGRVFQRKRRISLTFRKAIVS